MTKPITWTMYTGQRIRPKDMTDQHLHNTMAMLAINGGNFTLDKKLLNALVKESLKRGLQYGFEGGQKRTAYAKVKA